MSVVVKKIGDMSVKVISADDIASIRREISSRDMEMDKRAVAAVNSAINRAQVCNSLQLNMIWQVEGHIQNMPMGVGIMSTKKSMILQPPLEWINQEKKIYLFGSYARGEADENSDLDFLVFGGEGFKLNSILALGEELREVLKKKVDIF